MQYEGKIKYIGSIEYVGHNQLEKRTVVLEEVADREHKGGIAFDLIKDKVKLTDPYEVGDRVTASLSFKCNYHEPTDRYYTSISCWKIEGDHRTSESVDDDVPF